MRIALTYNLQIQPTEEEAEFDRPETIAALSEALRRLGHEVETVEVGGPASRLVARLEALNPDMVFNIAEGRNERFRVGFYPGLFSQLAIPFTGSDAHVCTLALDKRLTKLTCADVGVPTPRWSFVDDLSTWTPPAFEYPVIVKPNFEGSSKGITEESVVEEAGLLLARVAETLRRYPQGVLVEEYISGKDVFVDFLERSSPGTGGVLPAGEYQYAEEVSERRRHLFYDYELKHHRPGAVSLRVPARLPASVEAAVARYARIAFDALRVRDFGRIDFRVTDSGGVYLIDVDPLPSLRPGSDLYLAAAEVGLGGVEAVLDAILRSAASRQGLAWPVPRRNGKRPLRVGFTFNLKRSAPQAAGDYDAEAEYDSPKTIAAIHDAIASYGHEVIDLEATPELPSLLAVANVDVVFNVAEGLRGRNRESQVPALLELLDIPYTGSDPATLSITLDKVLAKRVVRQHGISTPNFVVMETGKERLPKDLRFPVIVKPAAEGSSKGVFASSVVTNEADLRATARDLATRYGHPALVEEFLTGREFTVALLGETRPKALPPMEIVFIDPDEAFPVYTFEDKLEWSKRLRYDAPAVVDSALGREIERVAKEAFAALGCRDVARIDLRLDADGKVNFIECNPLPGLTPGWSDLCLISTAAGLDYRDLIGEILAPAIRRHRERQRERKAELAKARGTLGQR